MNRDPLPPLVALRAFEAVARKLSFKAAADELSVSPTAISHHIRHLEAYIGTRLLERTPKTCRLTSDGSLLFEAATSGFSEIRQAVSRLRRNVAKPFLTLSATPAFLSLWLVPRMREIAEQLPGLNLRLHASKTVASLEGEGIDVAIRYGASGQTSADSIALRQDEFTPVCSPSLKVRKLDDLRRVELLHVDGYRVPRPAPSWERWCKHAGIERIDTEAGPRFNDSLHALQSAIAGQGAVLASPVIVHDALSSGALVRPFRQALKGATYYFVCAQPIAARDDAQALLAWFQRRLATES
jgi:LysR family glycine cleavage system transcriptional activator